jgi:hypothetical protein
LFGIFDYDWDGEEKEVVKDDVIDQEVNEKHE